MALSDLTAAKASAESRLATVLAELDALTVTAAGGKPDAVDGVKHQAYKDGLVKEAQDLQDLIAKLRAEIALQDTDGQTWQYISEWE